MNSPLYAVGVGPGDPELLTLKAARLIREADVIVAPSGADGNASLALGIVAAHLAPERQQILTRTFPMTRDRAQLQAAWQAIAAEVAELVQAGRKVVFVTLGDPTIYSTFAYIQEHLRQSWPLLQIELVPGISSFTAAAAAAGLSLVLGSERLALAAADIDATELQELLTRFDAVVLFKVARHFPALRSMLQAAGLGDKALFARRVGQPEQSLITDLDLVQEADLDYFSLLLVRR